MCDKLAPGASVSDAKRCKLAAKSEAIALVQPWPAVPADLARPLEEPHRLTDWRTSAADHEAEGALRSPDVCRRLRRLPLECEPCEPAALSAHSAPRYQMTVLQTAALDMTSGV